MTDVPLLPLRLLTHPFGDDGLYHALLAHPGRSALYAVRVPRCRGLASGFLPTPLRSDAVASGSGLASPLPLEDFHLQSITHAGRTIGSDPLDFPEGHLDQTLDQILDRLIRTILPSPEISRCASPK